MIKLTGFVSVQGKIARKIAKWLELWGVPHSLTPKGWKITVDYDYEKDFFSAFDHVIKGVEFPEELYQQGGECLWCKNPLPIDFVELRKLEYKWFFCNFTCLEEQLNHNSRIFTDLDNVMDEMDKKGVEKGCEDFKPQNPLALVMPMTCQYCVSQGACEREVQ